MGTWKPLASLKGEKGDPVGWERGEIPFGTNINTWHTSDYDGSWVVGSNGRAETIIGAPVKVPFQLLKLPGTGHQIVTSYTEGNDEPSLYFRGITSITGKLWSSWERLNSLGSDSNPRLLPSGTNINFYHALKRGYTYEINSQAVADTITGLPGAGRPGVLKDIKSTGFQTYMEYGASPTYWFRGITSVTTKAWGEWQALNGGGGSSKADTATPHLVRADMARKRLGYKIGTGGRGVILLRFDDYPQDFLTKVLPELRANNLPAYWACTVRHVETEQPTPWATVQAWALNDGVQNWGHSWTHSAASTPAALQKEIVESADYFETNMPAVRIDGWVMPGTGADNPYGGYNGVTDADFYDTEAGRLILSRYGIVNAARGGALQPAGGHPIGQSHLTFERWTLAQFKDEVTAAAKAGAALSLMAHPQNIGLAGYMSTADFKAAMSWLAAERDAGRVMTLTGNASAVLDPDSNYRHNLLPGTFKGGLQGWSGTGWTVSNGLLVGPNTTDPVTYAIPTGPVAWARGGTRELHAVVSATASTVIKVEVTGGALSTTKTYTIPAGDWVDVRNFFTIPYTGASTVTVKVSRVSGGVPRFHQINAYAA